MFGLCSLPICRTARHRQTARASGAFDASEFEFLRAEMSDPLTVLADTVAERGGACSVVARCGGSSTSATAKQPQSWERGSRFATGPGALFLAPEQRSLLRGRAGRLGRCSGPNHEEHALRAPEHCDHTGLGKYARGEIGPTLDGRALRRTPFDPRVRG